MPSISSAQLEIGRLNHVFQTFELLLRKFGLVPQTFELVHRTFELVSNTFLNFRCKKRDKKMNSAKIENNCTFFFTF